MMTAFLLNDSHLQAFVDSEIQAECETRIWHCILDNSVLRHQHEELIVQKQLLQRWWASISATERKLSVPADEFNGAVGTFF
ncbi:MAG: hypothetical protein PSY14_12790 [bacterium]|nr:hypothetical protein [bacterium]